jgi:hypothetical protein
MKCYHYDQIRHIVKDYKVKIRIVNILKKREEANKTSSQYFGLKKVKEREEISCWNCTFLLFFGNPTLFINFSNTQLRSDLLSIKILTFLSSSLSFTMDFDKNSRWWRYRKDGMKNSITIRDESVRSFSNRVIKEY